jgi:hypothetical protein
MLEGRVVPQASEQAQWLCCARGLRLLRGFAFFRELRGFALWLRLFRASRQSRPRASDVPSMLALPLLSVASVATPFNFPTAALARDDENMVLTRGLRRCFSLLGFLSHFDSPLGHLINA